MKNISLLPPEIRAQEIAREKGASYLAYSFLVLIVFIVVYLILAVATFAVHMQAKSITNDRVAVQKECAEYQVYENLINEIQKANELHQKAIGVPMDWSQNLQDINRYIPANVWLTELNISRANMVVRGQALDPTSVARWVETIQSVPGIADVRCQFARDLENTGVYNSSFEIQSGVSPGAAPQIKTEGGA